jgi:hypothetical protein
MVDSTSMQQVLLHHRHVLDAQIPRTWFDMTTHDPQRATSGGAGGVG